MLSFLPRSSVALAMVVLGLPFAASGACGGGTACFEYTQPEYALHNNSCPAQQDALPNFSNPACPGAVVAVDSAGSFDGELCCYAVTYSSIVPDCGVSDSTGNSSGDVSPGVGGFSGGMVATFESATASTGTGTTPGCQSTCQAALANGGAPCSGNALSSFQALLACVCASPGNCIDACEPLCQSLGVDTQCSACLATTCSSPFSVCMSN